MHRLRDNGYYCILKRAETRNRWCKFILFLNKISLFSQEETWDVRWLISFHFAPSRNFHREELGLALRKRWNEEEANETREAWTARVWVILNYLVKFIERTVETGRLDCGSPCARIIPENDSTQTRANKTENILPLFVRFLTMLRLLNR